MFFFADVDGSGELAPLHTVMLPMGESLSSSEEDGSYSACCPSSNSSSSEPEISMSDPSRTAAITSWALKTRFTFCGAHTFLDSSLNTLPGAHDRIFPAKWSRWCQGSRVNMLLELKLRYHLIRNLSDRPEVLAERSIATWLDVSLQTN